MKKFVITYNKRRERVKIILITTFFLVVLFLGLSRIGFYDLKYSPLITFAIGSLVYIIVMKVLEKKYLEKQEISLNSLKLEMQDSSGIITVPFQRISLIQYYEHTGMQKITIYEGNQEKLCIETLSTIAKFKKTSTAKEVLAAILQHIDYIKMNEVRIRGNLGYYAIDYIPREYIEE